MINNVSSRKDTARVIQARSEKVVLGVALLFLAAGSFWTHLSQGAYFLTLPNLLAWALVTAAPLLNLAFPRLERVLILTALAGLQSSMWLAFGVFKMPYLPTAGLFFLASSAALSAYRYQRPGHSWALWGLSWASAWGWSWVYNSDPGLLVALSVACAASALLVASFFAISRFHAQALASDLESLGPRQNYEKQRLQASKLQTLGQFAASLAHEIANPLLAIRGYNHQIQTELKNSDQITESGHESAVGGATSSSNHDQLKVAADRISFNLDRITVITKLLRNFSRDTTHDERHPVSLQDVIEDTFSLVQHHVKSAGVSLLVEKPESDALVMGNLVELSQLLANLVSNARDACRDSTVKRVTVGYTLHKSEVSLWVRDTGAGITPDQQARIFAPFYTTKESGQGTGLGLYMAKMIAERHHGDLRVQRVNVEDKAETCFVLKLPRLAAFEERSDEDDGHADDDSSGGQIGAA